MVTTIKSRVGLLGGALALGVSVVGLTAEAADAQEQTRQGQNFPLSATTSDNSDTAYIAEIVVTAQKREQTLSDVPLSITALTGSQLVEKGINDLQDLVKVTPGLSFANSGRGVPVISLRGVGFFEQAIGGRPTVSIYLDEAPLPFSVEAQSASFDLERVEVLKGPQGTLFGQSSTGGAINYIAAKPTNHFEAGVTASYGNYNRVGAQGHVSGPFSSTLSARLAFHAQQGDDWQYAYTGNDSLGRQNFTQGRFLLDWKPTDQFSALLTVTGFYDGSDTQAPQFIGVRRAAASIPLLVAFPVAPRDPRAADWRPGLDLRRDNKFVQTTLRADYSLSDAMTLTSLSSYSHMDVDSLNGDSTTLGNFDIHDVGTVESYSEELRLSGDVGGLHYLAGGNYQHDITDELVETLTPYATSTAVAGDAAGTKGAQQFSTVAAFADATYDLTSRLRVNAGARYTRQDLDYQACLVTLNAFSAATYTATLNRVRSAAGLAPISPVAIGQCVSLDANRNPAQAVGNLDEDNVSWRAGIDFKPTPRTLLYANASKGYKAGSTPVPGASSIEQFRPVTQESVLAYEVGLKSSLFNRALDVTAAAFYYDYTNKQLLGRNVFTPNIFGAQAALVNIPKSRISGAEAQLTLHPFTGMTLGAAATYLDTRVKGDFFNYDLVGALVNFKDRPFPYTPKWQLVFNGDYRIPVSASLTGTFGWDANYRTSTVAGFGGDPRLNIDSYWLVDLRIGVEAADGKWKASLYGRNVFNEYYWNNVSAGSDSLRRYTGMPATYGVQVSYRY